MREVKKQWTHVHVLLGNIDEGHRSSSGERLVLLGLEPLLAHVAIMLVFDVDEVENPN